MAQHGPNWARAGLDGWIGMNLDAEGAAGALCGGRPKAAPPLWGLAFVHSACLTSSEDIKIHQNASRFAPIHPSTTHVLRGTLFRETFSEICTLKK